MLKLPLRFVLVATLVAALIGCVENGPAEDFDAKDCDASVDGNMPPDAGVDAPLPVNHVPVVRITSPTANASFEVGTSVVVMVDAFDSDVNGGAVRLEVYYQRSGDPAKYWIGVATRLSGTTYQIIWPTADLSVGTYRLVAVAKGDKWHQEGDVDITGSPEVPILLTSHDNPLPTIGSFVATPSSCTGPCTTNLGWSGVTNATSCSINTSGGSGLATSGNLNVSVNATMVFTLTCAGPGGSVNATASVTVNNIPPTTITSFTVNPDTLTGPGNITATWFSNGTSCQLDRLVGTVYETVLAGLSPNSSANVGIVSSTTFRLTCMGPGGSASLFDTVTVGSPAPTIGLFTATPSSCTGPCTSNLAYAGVTGATSCSINTTGGSGLPGTSGNLNVSVNATTTYTLTCVGPGGSVNANASVTVNSIPATTITNFTVTPTNCTTSCTATLNWASNGTSCTASNGWTGTKAATGSQNVTVASTTTFTLTCTGPGGLSSPSSQTVAVASETPMAFDVVCPAGTTVTNLWFWPLVGSGYLASIPVTSAGGIWHSPVGAGSATVEYPNRWANWLAGDATFHANAPTGCYSVLSFYGDGRHSAPYHLAAGEAGWGWAWNDQSRAH